MTLNQPIVKRLILILLTLVVVIRIAFLLFGSLGEPQISSRLELYQTDLLLNTTELPVDPDIGWTDATRKVLLGNDPLEEALKQYQAERELAQKNLTRLRDRRTSLETTLIPPSSGSDPLQTPLPSTASTHLDEMIRQQETLLSELDLRRGILQVQTGKVAAAIQTWTELSSSPAMHPITKVLIGLWSDPPQLLPNAESQIQQTLEGWFRSTALERLYQLQQRSDALVALQAARQITARQTLVKLSLISTVPLLGGLLGSGLLIFLVVQWLLRGKQSLVAQNANLSWQAPWEWDTILLVLSVGFFLVGQFLVPLLIQIGALSLTPLFRQLGLLHLTTGQIQATSALLYYLLMAGLGLLVLYLAIKAFFPLPQGWFAIAQPGGGWLLWGLGGYLAALPLMLLVSLLNEQVWQGQGGSNPLLQIILEEGDPIALTIFFLTAAVAAPIFEETLFRGFLLPSLTRYLPIWGAIALSGLIFAVVHLSLSEVLPLTVLGMILGFIYTRSRSLLSPMLLHSLWNSATMLGLFVLGSGNQ